MHGATWTLRRPGISGASSSSDAGRQCLSDSDRDIRPMARRQKKSKYTASGEAAMDEIEEIQRSWVVIPVAEAYEMDGVVVLKAPRFQTRVGKGLVNILKRDQEFNLHLDEFGSQAWKLFDGKRTVGEISDLLAEEAGDESRISSVRLLMFLRSLKTAGVIRVVSLRRAATTVK